MDDFPPEDEPPMLGMAKDPPDEPDSLAVDGAERAFKALPASIWMKYGELCLQWKHL